MESLKKHLECLKLCGDETESHNQILESLNGVLLALAEDMHRCSSLLRDSGIFPALARILERNPRCAVKAAQVLAEIAKNEEMKKLCIEADLVLILVPQLKSTDEEMLLHTGRAIGRICYEKRDLQEELVKLGVITSLVRILTEYPENEALTRVDLLALCNLADLDSAKEALSKTNVAELLVKQLRRAEKHERLELIIEVLQALVQNDALKMQLVETGVHEALSEILLRLQGSLRAEDTLIVKAASDLIVSLLLGDGNCIRMVQLGIVHQLLDLLEKHMDNGDVSIQHAALSALRNFAIPVANKIQMLEEGVAERIKMLLRSEMPPVQFKLLGTLRMLTDGQAEAAEILGQDTTLLNTVVQWCNSKDQAGVCGEANRLLASLLSHSRSQEVVKAIQQAQGVKHLVSMTTSEHVIMQNEALIALAIASAISLEVLEDSFKETKLVQNLHKLLQDERTGPEVKYNSMSLLCNLLNSGDLRQEIEEDNFKETLETLCSYSNACVVNQAVMTLQILKDKTQKTRLSSP
ncbi:PREDICTED: rap1 GTPase-GDP dissociation stimulator 1-like [Gavialis gangeticus]|uniref:rap1 GTPase-GDP dissociation stimulator 1-like n=1 Tax=Gavialis gangeticus TaxID=94835 RepID=UPI00092E268F|nr:PREDICTED: rap1 GTPase-GDP dissociation stimulator 1-like [Gavialis gangeticus]